MASEEIVGALLVEMSLKTDQYLAAMQDIESKLNTHVGVQQKATESIGGFWSSLGDAIEGQANRVSYLLEHWMAPYFELKTAIEAVNAVTVDSVYAFAEYDDAFTKLSVVVNNMPENLGFTTASMERLAQSMSDGTQFTVSAGLAAEATMLKFQSLNDPAIMARALPALEDFAAFTGRDLPAAAELLGRALEAPEKATIALRRAGVILSDTQKEQIQTLLEYNDVSGAQGVILDLITARTHGAAEAMGGDLKGQMEQTKKSFEEFKTALGGTNVVRFWAEEALTALQNIGGYWTHLIGLPAMGSGTSGPAAGLIRMQTEAANLRQEIDKLSRSWLQYIKGLIFPIKTKDDLIEMYHQLNLINDAIRLQQKEMQDMEHTPPTPPKLPATDAMKKMFEDEQKAAESAYAAESSLTDKYAVQVEDAAVREAKANVNAATQRLDEEIKTGGSLLDILTVRNSKIFDLIDQRTAAEKNAALETWKKEADIEQAKYDDAKDKLVTFITYSKENWSHLNDDQKAQASDAADQLTQLEKDHKNADFNIYSIYLDKIAVADTNAEKDKEATYAKENKAMANLNAEQEKDIKQSYATRHEFIKKTNTDLLTEYQDMEEARLQGDMVNEQRRDAIRQVIIQRNSDVWKGWRDGWDEAWRKETDWYDNTKRIAHDAVTGLASDLNTAFNSFFTDALSGNISGLQKYLDAFQRAVISTFAKILADTVTAQLMSIFAGQVVGGGGMPGPGGALGILGTTGAQTAAQAQGAAAFNQAAAAGEITLGTAGVTGTVGGGSLAGVAAPAVGLGALALLSYANKDAINKALGGGTFASLAEIFVNPIAAVQDIGSALGITLGASTDKHAIETQRDTIIAAGIMAKSSPKQIRDALNKTKEAWGNLANDPKWNDTPALDAYEKTWNDALDTQQSAESAARTYVADAAMVVELQKKLVATGDISTYQPQIDSLAQAMANIKTQQGSAASVLSAVSPTPQYNTFLSGYTAQAQQYQTDAANLATKQKALQAAQIELQNIMTNPVGGPDPKTNPQVSTLNSQISSLSTEISTLQTSITSFQTANPLLYMSLASIASSAMGNIFTGPSLTTIAETGSPEAVLPLRRTAGGQLGVQASGGGGVPQIIQLVMNGRVLADLLFDMSRTGQLRLDTNSLITVGRN